MYGIKIYSVNNGKRKGPDAKPNGLPINIDVVDHFFVVV